MVLCSAEQGRQFHELDGYEWSVSRCDREKSVWYQFISAGARLRSRAGLDVLAKTKPPTLLGTETESSDS